MIISTANSCSHRLRSLGFLLERLQREPCWSLILDFSHRCQITPQKGCAHTSEPLSLSCTVTIAPPCIKCPPSQHLLRMKGMCHAFAGTDDLGAKTLSLNLPAAVWTHPTSRAWVSAGKRWVEKKNIQVTSWYACHPPKPSGEPLRFLQKRCCWPCPETQWLSQNQIPSRKKTFASAQTIHMSS